MSQLLDDIKALRALLTPNEAWTKGQFARDKDGLATLSSPHPGFDAPVCWCLLGAARNVTHFRSSVDLRANPRMDALQGAIRGKLDEPIDDWNDDPKRTHTDVLNLLDELIKEHSDVPA